MTMRSYIATVHVRNKKIKNIHLAVSPLKSCTRSTYKYYTQSTANGSRRGFVCGSRVARAEAELARVLVLCLSRGFHRGCIATFVHARWQCFLGVLLDFYSY